MSEPMTTVEIEDVLFSIRRLVSEDLRPTHKLVSAALQHGASKLILTPALRIVSDERSALSDGLNEPSELHPVLLIKETDIAPEAETAFPVFGSVRQSEPDFAVEKTASANQEIVPADATFLTTAISRINGLANGDAAQSQDRIEAVVAAVGAAVGPDEWELDGGDPAPQAAAWASATWTSHGADGSSEKPSGMPQQAAVKDTVFSANLSKAPDQIEDVIASISQIDGSEDAVIGADSIVFHDSILADHGPTGQASGDAADDDQDDSSDFVSEDLLREIVRDMIRDELQGALGERITRNVRKLVRAEISRALASRDFDTIASRG